MPKKYKYTMKTGRPTDYSPEILKQTKEYILQCEDEYEEFHRTRGSKSDSYDRLVRVKLPTIEGLSVHLNVDRTTIYEWKGKYKDFSHTLGQLLAIQAERLQDGGLSGDYNPMIAKLILSSNHNMREKSDVTTDDRPIVNGVEINIRK
ncbi:MAG: terminase small subunit [Patescibacteria group bacterium]